jgi:anti-sigma factor (TIGR02949 family)
MAETTALEATCAEAEQHMQAYLDGQLASAVALTIDRHIAGCKGCASAYRFEVKLRAYVKRCCSETDDTTRCREELRQRLERCRDIR